MQWVSMGVQVQNPTGNGHRLYVLDQVLSQQRELLELQPTSVQPGDNDMEQCSHIAHGLALVIFVPAWCCSCVAIITLCYTVRQLHYIKYLAMEGVPISSEDAWQGVMSIMGLDVGWADSFSWPRQIIVH